jgi:hypothetical protein
MVAGDHDRADSGGVTLFHCRLRFGARRVDHPDEADEDELAFDVSSVTQERLRAIA